MFHRVRFARGCHGGGERNETTTALHASPHHMALDVQKSTRAVHPHLVPGPICRGPLLHRAALNSEHVLHTSAGRPPAEINSAVSRLLSLLPGSQQPRTDDVALDKVAPMIAMQAPQGLFPKPSLECLPVIAPKKRKASPSSDSGHNTPLTLTSKSVAGVSRTRLPPRSRFGCW